MLNIYKASAGSGKTHTLTRDFIFLSFDNPIKFSNILAVTFTNKAAGEMKERIIEQLAILAKEPDKSDFFYDIVKKFNLNNTQISKNARKNLTKILHNYTFFNISTIDSFVQKVIRAFAFELQIPNSYALELDTEKVATELTDELILDLDENKNLQNWLNQYASDKISDGKSWDFREDIMQFSKQLFKEDFYNIFDNINISDEDFDKKISTILNLCFSIKSKYEKNFDELILKGKQYIDKSGIINVKGQKIKYLTNFFLKNKKYEVSLNNTLKKAIENDDWWTKTTKDSIKRDWRNTIDALASILNEIIDFEVQKGKEYFSALAIKNNIFDFGVLNKLSNLLPEYRDKNNSLLISDITLLLKKIIGNNDAPFIYEKIGNKYKNIMIDEFQDTSGFQWHNFKPLILNSLAFDYYNLIVGDVKQSIYRWRSGDWRLLHSKIKEEIGKSYIEEVSLDTNWRSRKEIVEFNNSLFKVLPKILQEKILENDNLLEETKSMSNVILDAYKDTVQKVAPKNNSGGFVNISFHEGNEWKNNIDAEIPILVEKLLYDKTSSGKNFSAGDIGILVRTNGDANRIMKLLLNHNSMLSDDKKFNVISAESLLLLNSLAVKMLINLLKYVILPDNSIYLTEIAANYKRLKTEKIDENIFYIKNIKDAFEFFPQEFAEHYENFIHLSLYELIEKLISIFTLNNFSEEIPFIRTFQEVIANFINRSGSDIAGFINFWDNNSHKLSVQLSDQKDAVQVTTIHKSKGLAFGVVIMPYIDLKLTPKASTVLWVDTAKTSFDFFPYLPVNFNSLLSKSDFQKEYFEETIFSYMDNLNMLYVAFTRAKERIYGFANLTKQKTNSTISDNLFKTFSDYQKYSTDDAFLNLNEFWDKNEKKLTIGNEDDIFAEKKSENSKFEITNYPSYDWTKNIAIIAHAEDLIAETVEVRRNAMKQGIIMHEILSLIKTKNDVNEVIESMSNVGKININEIEEITSLILDLFKNEQFASWFDNNWEVFSEKEILTRYGATKIPDRVVMNEKEIIVIDYKFGSKRPEHPEQVKKYILLLEDMYPDKNVFGYLFYAEESLIQAIKK